MIVHPSIGVCAVAAVLAACSAQGDAPAAPARGTAEPFGQAGQSFRAGHYAQAYGRYMELADAGHAVAARIALTMFRHGRQAFGSDWAASDQQLRQWSALSGESRSLASYGRTETSGD